MKVTLIGVQDLDFTSKGDVIKGIKIHYSFMNNNTYGQQVDTAFFRSDVFDSFAVPIDNLIDDIGTLIEVDFNNKGKPCCLSLLSKANTQSVPA